MPRRRACGAHTHTHHAHIFDEMIVYIVCRYSLINLGSISHPKRIFLYSRQTPRKERFTAQSARVFCMQQWHGQEKGETYNNTAGKKLEGIGCVQQNRTWMEKKMPMMMIMLRWKPGLSPKPGHCYMLCAHISFSFRSFRFPCFVLLLMHILDIYLFSIAQTGVDPPK